MAEERQARTIGLVGDVVGLTNQLLAGRRACPSLARRGGHDISVLPVGRNASTSTPRTTDYARRVRHTVAENIALRRAVQPFTVPESFDRVCVEAMVAARPVVAFDHGAVGELVEDRPTGLPCPTGGAAAVAGELLKLGRNPRGCIEMGPSARRDAPEGFGGRPDRHDAIGNVRADFAIAGA